jgi:hypothetical protein
LHVAILEIGEDGGEVARFGDHRTRGGAKADAQFAGDDLRQRRLAEPRRAEEQDMVERIAAAPGGIDEHAQVLSRRLLADELVQCLRPQRRVEILRAPVAADDPLLLHRLCHSASAPAVERLFNPLEPPALPS